MGLLVAALFHILELGSLLVDGGVAARRRCRRSALARQRACVEAPVCGRPLHAQCCPSPPPRPAVQGRWLLPVLLVHWALVLLASIIGLRWAGGRAGGIVSGPCGGGAVEGAAVLWLGRNPAILAAIPPPPPLFVRARSASGEPPAAYEYEPLAAERV